MEQSVNAQIHITWLGSKCRSKQEKAAWSDCVTLYQDTINILNQALNPTKQSTSYDLQTWLTTSLTNTNTCQTGFHKVGVGNNVLPLIPNKNISKIISDFLTLNNASSFIPPKTNKNGFPRWLTVISGSRSVGGGSTTFNSTNVGLNIVYSCDKDGFIARGITFRNTEGPENHQAGGLRCGADLSVFHRCAFEGYQDTLYVHSQRQFYKECHIFGTVDFIFGNAAVVFQSCNIYATRSMQKQKNAIAAEDPNQNTGICIQNSRVMAVEDLVPVLSSFKTFLGRPWREYSRTVFLQTYLDALVDLAGDRVKWGGYHAITSATEASKFTVENFIAGKSWLPATGIPFLLGLDD
ncbi:Pectinesterase 2 [Glycine soja]|uniref:Pectinesterase n=1 Tax=Glycine soja TaxID=3848 RepID=A0A0B2QX11_GLYSO|nr:Pectinesterase 2 [Glycine soja]